MRRSLALVPLVFIVACGGNSPTAPSPAPAPSPVSGRLTDLEAARDIIDWNMEAGGGASYRKTDRICRWELPIPVYIADGPDRERVIDALEYWAANSVITFRLIDGDTHPRLLIRFGTDGLPPWGGGRSLVDGTNPDNSARSALIVYEPGGGTYCGGGSAATACVYLYRHELGHTLGIYPNISTTGLMSGSAEISDREQRMLAALYSLPHGARVEADGSWRVLSQP